MCGCRDADGERYEKNAAMRFSDSFRQIAVHSSEPLIALGDDVVRVVDANTARTIWESKALGEGVGDLAWSPDGRLLAVACYDGPLVVWSTESWKEVANTRDTASRRKLGWSQSRLFVLLRRGGEKWSVEEWQFSRDCQLTHSRIRRVTPDVSNNVRGYRFFGTEPKLALWTTSSFFAGSGDHDGYGLEDQIGRYALFECADVCGATGMTAYATMSGEVMTLDLYDEPPRVSRLLFDCKLKLATFLSLSPDGSTIAVGGWTDNRDHGRIQVFRVSDGKLLASLETLGELREAAWDAAGNRVWVIATIDRKGQHGRSVLYCLDVRGAGP